MKKNKFELIKKIIPLLLACILIPTVLIFAATNLSSRSQKESMILLEESLRRAVVQCYAIEGFYPEDLSYLIDNYGVAINESRYVVHYTYVASNLMPDITVIQLSSQ